MWSEQEATSGVDKVSSPMMNVEQEFFFEI